MDIFEKIQKLKKEVRLTESSRDAGRHHLSVLMSQNPLPETPQGINVRHIILMRNLRFYLAAFGMIFILAGTATTLAAERSLPGDALYALKLGLTEPLRDALSVSNSAKSDWQVQKINRRLEEAEKLAVLGRLDESARKEVEKNLVAAESNASRIISKNSSAGIAKATSELEAVLSAHSRVISAISAPGLGLAGDGEESRKEELGVLREKVREIYSVTKEKRIRAEELSVQSSSSLQDARNVVEKTLSSPISETMGFDAGGTLGERNISRESVASIVSPPESDEPSKLMEEAGQKIREGDYGAGLRISNDVVRQMKEAEIVNQASDFYGVKIEPDDSEEALPAGAGSDIRE
ncbi:MAG TPA: hypothetical protein VJL32_01995 [Candidatus Paceibacterota bacterium]